MALVGARRLLGLTRSQGNGSYPSLPTALTSWRAYYVEADGAGSDTNDGRSAGQPLATIGEAITRLNSTGSPNFGQVILLPGTHTVTDTITKRQGIELRGWNDRPASSGQAPIISYTGPDDGRPIIETAFDATSDDTFGRISGIRVTCTAGYTQTVGIHWRNAQNLSRLSDVLVTGVPYGVVVDDKQAAATNTMPGYVICERVWVTGGIVPWTLRMGFTSILFDMCAGDFDTTTTDVFLIQPPAGASSARGGKDGNLIFVGFKSEGTVAGITAGGAGDCNQFTFNTDAAAAFIGCSFRKAAGNSTGKMFNYTVAPGSANARPGAIPIEAIACHAANTLHLVAAPAVTPAIVVDSPNAAGGETHQFSYKGFEGLARNFRSLATSAETAPSAGLDAYGRTIASRAQLALLGTTGKERLVGQPLWARLWALVTPQSSTSVRTQGSGAPASTNGTISHPGVNKDYGYPAQIASAASGAAQANVILSTPQVYRGTAGDVYGGFFAHSRVRFPDASYDNTGASTGARLWGLAAYNSSGTTLYTTDRGGTQHLVGFNRENVNGANTDTNWQVVTNNNSASTVTDTTMAFTVGHVYDFYLWCPEGSTSIFWQVEDITAGTKQSGSVATTLPGATSGLIVTAGLATVDATARICQFLRVFAEADSG